METLIINIPDKKSRLVKQILKGLGVTIHEKHFSSTSYKDKIQHVSVWTDDDLKPFDNAKNSFESLNPAQW
jgi:cysteine synthase